MEDDSCSHTTLREQAQKIVQQLDDPRALVFVETLNACFYKGKQTKSQKEIAAALNVVSAAITHWRSGKRNMPIEMIGELASYMGWSVEIEQQLITSWFYDRSIKAWSAYVKEMLTHDNYRQLTFVIFQLHELRNKLVEAKNRVRSISPPEAARIDP